MEWGCEQCEGERALGYEDEEGTGGGRCKSDEEGEEGEWEGDEFWEESSYEYGTSEDGECGE
jgi:hypothetical protein